MEADRLTLQSLCDLWVEHFHTHFRHLLHTRSIFEKAIKAKCLKILFDAPFCGLHLNIHGDIFEDAKRLLFCPNLSSAPDIRSKFAQDSPCIELCVLRKLSKTVVAISDVFGMHRKQRYLTVIALINCGTKREIPSRKALQLNKSRSSENAASLKY